MSISSVTIRFDNADLFSLTMLTGSVPSDPSQSSQDSQFIPPSDNGATIPTDHTYTFAKPFIVPNGEGANFSLSLTITTNPQITLLRTPVIRAGLVDFGAGPGSHGWGALPGVLMLLSLCTTVFATGRRRTVIALIILMLAAASQVGCDNGSVPGPSGGVPMSTQTARDVAAMNPAHENVGVGGLPALMSTISVP
jgi:hypothetical protein